MALQRGGPATLARTGEPSLQLAAELAHAIFTAQIGGAARVQVAGQATHSFECRAGAPRCLPLSAWSSDTRGECHLAAGVLGLVVVRHHEPARQQLARDRRIANVSGTLDRCLQALGNFVEVAMQNARRTDLDVVAHARSFVLWGFRATYFAQLGVVGGQGKSGSTSELPSLRC